MKYFVLLFLIFIDSAAWAKLYLNVSIYNKKGIDLGLTLASELHSIEEVHRGQPIFFRMRTGIEVVLKANFEEEVYNYYGPSNFILVRGKIRDRNGEILEDFMNKPISIPLGSKEIVVHNKETQLIELKIEPEVR